MAAQSALVLAKRVLLSASPLTPTSQSLRSQEYLLKLAQNPGGLHISTVALWPLPQLCWLHSPAGSSLTGTTHAYHHGGNSGDGAGDDKDKSSNSARASPGGLRADSDQSPRTQQFKDIQESIERVLQRDSDAREAMQLPEYVARHAMRDPLGVLMTSQGVPLGISWKVNSKQLLQDQQQQRSREAEADKRDWQELLGRDSSNTSSSASNNSSTQYVGAEEDPSMSLPSTDAQMLRQKLIQATQKLVSAARSKHTQDQEHSNSSSSSSLGHQAALAGDTSDSWDPHSPVGQQVKEQLKALLASADADSWGTTQQSPAEIAQHIADSNRAARRGGSGSGGGGDGGSEGGEGSDDEDDDPLTLSAGEERYADPSAVAADLKEMDEIFEVLAKVPWLDDEDVDERELRGVVAVGLLGTLEEVGWQLRDKLLALWAGERDSDILTAGVGPREAAALTAILYHMQKLEEEYGRPPQKSIDAALAVAGGSMLPDQENQQQ